MKIMILYEFHKFYPTNYDREKCSSKGKFDPSKSFQLLFVRQSKPFEDSTGLIEAYARLKKDIRR